MHLCMFPSIPETIVGFLGEESTRVSGLTWVTFSHSNELANVAGTDNSVNVGMSEQCHKQGSSCALQVCEKIIAQAEFCICKALHPSV